MRVILLSGKKQSGKNTVADMIRAMLGEFHVVNVAFADPLKDMCKDAFRPLITTLNHEFEALHARIEAHGSALDKNMPRLAGGHPYMTRDHNWYENKNNITRLILQIVGTDVVRRIQPHYWIEQTIAKIAEHKRHSWATVSDWRFPNEFELVDKAFPHAVSVRVVNNRKDDRSDTHISETALDDFTFQHTIKNNGSLEELKSQVQDLVYNLVEEGME
jgi:hypothetical protein